MLSFLFYLQEKTEEPFEINLLFPLMGFVFCGLPILISALILSVFIKRLRNREDVFSQWAREQEERADEQKRQARTDSDNLK